jgi:TM2 domain-containing membrane protein YozV
MKKIFVLLVLLSSFAFAQEITDSENKLTGILFTDSRITLEEFNEPSLPVFIPMQANKKSPFLAGVLSLIIPGAGEIYTGEYLKAAVFIALEAGLVTAGLIFDKKGEDKTSEFQNYADQNWDVVKYADWIVDNTQQEIGIDKNTQGLLPWERVNWQQLNNAERNAGSILGGGFSHTLPPHGDQQYFEMIGKYRQYSPGWNDYNTLENGSNWNLTTANMLFYAGERGKANDFYNTASAFVIGIYINHFLSALDGVWSAINYNDKLAVNMRVQGQQFADHYEYIPTVHLKYSF